MSYMVSFWRLERNGHGPFRQPKHIDGDRRILIELYDKFTAKDAPHIKSTVMWGLEDNGERFVYGCCSEEELREFFGETILTLCIEQGFKIKHYLVATCDVRYGDGEMAAKLRKGPGTARAERWKWYIE